MKLNLTLKLCLCLSAASFVSACATTAPDNTAAASTTSTASPTTAKSAAATADPAPGSPDELVCKSEKVTGSNFRKRVCKTRRQIAAEDAARGNRAGGFQRGSGQSIGGGSGG